MENERPQLESTLNNPTVAFIVFPDERAVVQILEILAPYSPEIRRLTLDAVQANAQYPERPMIRGCADETIFRRPVHMNYSLESRVKQLDRESELFHESPINPFLDACCEFGDDSKFVRNGELQAAYFAWCALEGEQVPLGREQFAEQLTANGFERRRVKVDGVNRRVWTGLSLRKKAAK